MLFQLTHRPLGLVALFRLAEQHLIQSLDFCDQHLYLLILLFPLVLQGSLSLFGLPLLLLLHSHLLLSQTCYLLFLTSHLLAQHIYFSLLLTNLLVVLVYDALFQMIGPNTRSSQESLLLLDFLLQNLVGLEKVLHVLALVLLVTTGNPEGIDFIVQLAVLSLEIVVLILEPGQVMHHLVGGLRQDSDLTLLVGKDTTLLIRLTLDDTYLFWLVLLLGQRHFLRTLQERLLALDELRLSWGRQDLLF